MNLKTFEEQLVTEVVEDMQRFSKTHAKENIYGFSLDCTMYESGIALHANTVEHLEFTVAEYAKDDLYRDESYAALKNELRWAAGDWKYMEVSIGYGDPEIWQQIEESLDSDLVEAFMCMLCRAAISIQSTGLLKEWWPTQDIGFICIEHDESIKCAKNRFQNILQSKS